MAKIRKLPSGNWHTRVYEGRDKNGKQVFTSITAPTKDEVIVALGEYKKQGKSRNADMTVRQAVRRYIDLSERVLSPTTIESYEKMFKYGFPHLMDVKLKDLTDEVCQEAIDKECDRPATRTKGTVSAKTVHNEWGLISSALKKQKLVFEVRLPRIIKKNEELPNPQIVFNAIKGTEVELPCMLAMQCGLRQSEIRGLDRNSIHGEELFIDKVVVDVNNVPTLKYLAKTDTSIRKVGIPPYIMSLIKNTDGYINPSQTDDFKPLVPLSHNGIYDPFRKAMDEIGVDLSFHDLRHLFASISLNILGQSIKTVQNAGGWKDERTLMKVYNQGFAEIRQEADKQRTEYFESLNGKSDNKV